MGLTKVRYKLKVPVPFKTLKAKNTLKLLNSSVDLPYNGWIFLNFYGRWVVCRKITEYSLECFEELPKEVYLEAKEIEVVVPNDGED